MKLVFTNKNNKGQENNAEDVKNGFLLSALATKEEKRQ